MHHDPLILAFVPSGEGLPLRTRVNRVLKYAKGYGLRCVGFVEGTSCRLPQPKAPKPSRQSKMVRNSPFSPDVQAKRVLSAKTENRLKTLRKHADFESQPPVNTRIPAPQTPALRPDFTAFGQSTVTKSATRHGAPGDCGDAADDG